MLELTFEEEELLGVKNAQAAILQFLNLPKLLLLGQHIPLLFSIHGI
jgi:hypothetical protein